MPSYLVNSDKCLVENVKATTSTFGITKLITDTSTEISDTTGLALAASVGYTLKTSIEAIKIPKDCVILSPIPMVDAFTTTIGYGTWSSLGSLSVGSATVYVYVRTA